MKPMRLWLLTVIMAVLLAGCGGSGGTTATDPDRIRNRMKPVQIKARRPRKQ